jgi:hypothetical protein
LLKLNATLRGLEIRSPEQDAALRKKVREVRAQHGAELLKKRMEARRKGKALPPPSVEEARNMLLALSEEFA